MTDFYQKLGVSKDASQDDIKQAYRSLANKHHPDKGGDQATFKNISVAYDTLGDPQKRAEYDNQQFNPYGHSQQFGNSFGGGFHDIFGQHSPFGDIFGRQHHMHRNRDLSLQCQVSLADSFTGKQIEASYQLPSGKQQSVVISVPAGVSHGDTIKYSGLGDDSIPGVARGSLNVTFIVEPDPVFKRVHDDIYAELEINPIEAIIGCKKQIKNIIGESSMLDVRAGVETGTEFAKMGGGFTNIHSGRKGRFVTMIKIKTPKINDPAIIEQLRSINDRLN